jgi:hypothetical protein
MTTNTYRRTYDNRKYAVLGDDNEDDDNDRFLDPNRTMKGFQASSWGLGF